MSNKKHILHSLALLCIIVSSFGGCNINRLADSLQKLAGQPVQTGQESVINGADIFAHFTGMTEQEFKKTTNATVVYDQKTKTYKPVIKTGITGPFSLDSTGNFMLKNTKTGQTYNAGQFETYGHEKLVAETADHTTKKPGTFSVVTSPDYNTLFNPYVDTIELQHLAAVNGEKAVFLVASDYDGIEAVSGDSDPSIDIYLGDVTQGPAASLGCFPGALLRLYSQIRENKQLPTDSFDPQKPRVHMLKADFLNTQNGYVYLNRDIVFNGPVEKFLQDNHYSFSIMYHKNQAAPVKKAIIGGGFDAFVVPEKQPNHTVDQIFSAGLSLGQYKTSFMNGHIAPEAFIEALTQKILFYIYDSAIRAAIKNGRDTVYLLPIGCGVFGNKKIWAGRALEQCKELIVQSGLTVKYIISGLQKRSFETQPEFDGFIDILKKLAQETGGTYIELTLENGQVVEHLRTKTSSPESQQKEAISLDKLARVIKTDTSKLFSAIPVTQAAQMEERKKLEALIEETIKTELNKNPKAFEVEDSNRLTPAHRIALEIFLIIRAEHWESYIDPEEAKLLDHVFAFALNKLRTDKKVLGKVVEHGGFESGYLKSLGITETPMTVGEFLNKILALDPSRWEKVRALKLT